MSNTRSDCSAIPDAALPVVCRGSEMLYASERFSLAMEHFDTPDGAVSRPAVRHPGAVAVLALPAPETVLLVRQWRYPLRRWTWELPAGTCRPGEDRLLAARRELEEETGYRAAELKPWFAFYPSMGLSDERLEVFLATGLRKTAMAPDHGELVEPRLCSFAELRALIRSGEAADAKTLLAVARLPGMADCYAAVPRC